MIRKKTVYLYNHQGKGIPYKNSLLDRGFVEDGRYKASIVLLDYDYPERMRRHRYQIYRGLQLVFSIPHAARPPIGWDGLFQPNRDTKAVFLIADGHIDVLRAYGFQKPLHVTGWPFCEMKPFSPTRARKALFGPIHPTSKSWLSDLDKRLNAETYKRLLKLVDAGHIHLTVRYIRGLENNGLWHDDRVTFVEDAPNLSHKEIDDSDFVVTHQTFGHIAAARGKPLLMMKESTPPRNGGNPREFKFVKSWNLYKDLVMYPRDILEVDECHVLDLIEKTCSSEGEDVADWKRRIIGKPFDPQLFHDTIMKYL